MAPVVTPSGTARPSRAGQDTAIVTAFVCANCARPAQRPDSAGRPRPIVPDFDWPVPTQELMVACSGRIQPEHVLKAFETGSRVVCVITCEEDNCHYGEGSKRCSRRVDYLRSILDEIGLGSERLMRFNLPGTATEDTILGCGETVAGCTIEEEDPRVTAIRDAVAQAVASLEPNPLFTGPVDDAAEDAYLEVDDSDDDNQE